MAINLTKGTSINLSKEISTSKNALVGLGWLGKRTSVGRRKSVDLDACVICYDSNGKRVEFVYYGKLASTGIKHSGDNLTGGGNENDPNEEIAINFSQLERNIQTVYVGMGIYSGADNLGEVESTFMNISQDKNEVVRYDIGKSYKSSRSILAGKFTRNGNDWNFEAIGAPVKKGFSHFRNSVTESNINSGFVDTNSSSQEDTSQETTENGGLLSKIKSWF